tara:strand:- start:4016 stop:4387 length:372 start_codon:yes stop_codon:yes gene_type:complete
MSFNIDIIEVIGTQCDDKTRFMLSCASKEYYGYIASTFHEKETARFVCDIRKLLIHCEEGDTKFKKIKRAHKLFRYLTVNLHIKKYQSMKNLVSASIKKLDELEEDGSMSKRKLRFYKKQLTI